MSQGKNLHEAQRWLITAQQDLLAAKALSENRFFAHACFLAQQSGEKALKAMWYLHDRQPWGSSILRLVTEFPDATELPNLDDWIYRAATLDRLYVPTRYPDALPDLTPGQNFFKQDADAAILLAATFVEAAQKAIA
jgi:HEPN domain-containing protein